MSARTPLSPARKRVALVTAGLMVTTVPALWLVNGSASAAEPGCQVTYTTNDWGAGFTANLAITNTGPQLSSWQLEWDFPSGQRVDQGWNATYSQSGAHVTATNVSYNGTIATGATVQIGFNGTNTSGTAGTNPSLFTLNGVQCGGTGTTGGTTGGTTTDGSTSTGSTSGTTGSTGSTTDGGPTTTGGTTGGNEEPPPGALQMEDLNRGLVSVRSGSANLVSWRLLGTESYDTAFNVYRNGTKVNSSPITGSTNYLDSGAPAEAVYTVRAVVGGTEQAASENSLRFTGGNYLDVPLSSPGSGYTPVEASPGDLDGDGQYELVVKWDPDNAKDNSQSGVTGNVYIDAYRLNGQRLWRIDLGRNIRAGAHYTQFQVYDYDGDGRAEVAMKTADATRDGRGTVIGNANADHRNSSGYILTGPEFLTMFDGRTGAALSTVPFEPARGNVSSWGDSYGNRVDRFLAGTAYLDGRRPSLIMARGYYTRAVIAAYDFRDGQLTRRWLFDSNASGNGGAYGQGNHQLSVADVDGDGRQEIVYGSATIDDNGRLMYATGFGHGDALHVGDFVPSRPGLEVFTIHEASNQPGADLHDARTGEVLFRTPASGQEGPGRGVAGDIHAGNAGAEYWGSGPNMGHLRNSSGSNVGRNPSSANFLVWWDGDPVRELLDGTRVDKYGTGGDTRLLTGSGVASSNGTKSTPVLSGDILGDWREEVIWRHSGNNALRIYATTHTTDRKLHTLVHDAQYRTALAWQNTAYNQPPHPSFFLGNGMSNPPQPNIYLR
ncbi:cellulose binding domain-containing protein [Streptomyces sp. YIM 98790]|uniref:rhamnogalacturonan lyase family protein n=1 Tax=Streptomyces sp. YIM 98790 TaxID=2689077 RepID=UPI00140889F3|nr:cellulose binding domain-containing protein [Streptomyces sp. YIM 98790]